MLRRKIDLTSHKKKYVPFTSVQFNLPESTRNRFEITKRVLIFAKFCKYAILDDLFIYLSIENRDAKIKCILSTQLFNGM